MNWIFAQLNITVVNSVVHAIHRSFSFYNRIKKFDWKFISLLSWQILKKLYGPGHIAIGNELIKLSSIQLSLGDRIAVDSINWVDVIFSQYYGSHVNTVYPYLQSLKREAHKLVQ